MAKAFRKLPYNIQGLFMFIRKNGHCCKYMMTFIQDERYPLHVRTIIEDERSKFRTADGDYHYRPRIRIARRNTMRSIGLQEFVVPLSSVKKNRINHY